MKTAMQQFIDIIRDTSETNEPVREAESSTLLKFCPVCHEIMPHKRAGNFIVCIACGQPEYPQPDISAFDIDA